MSTSFDLPELDVLTAGTIGPPGQRIFYLQARRASDVVTLRLEKGQVAALGEYLGGMLADLSTPEPLPAEVDLDLVEPVVAEWVVGSLAVAYDEADDRLVIVAEELVRPPDEDDEEDDATAEAVEPAVARFRATRDQVSAFVERAAQLVAAGRPPCRFCGRPLDPEGHVCPKSNGHRLNR